jgi:DeoR/GlpR family transcriptional regulator of sugar metabolism
MIESAATVIAPATGDKLGTAAPFVVSPLSALTSLVTEMEIPEAVLAPYRAAGLTIVQEKRHKL